MKGQCVKSVFVFCRLVIPEERLSCESVLYWKCLCQHLRALGDAAEDYLEMVLPTGSEFSAYLRQ